MKTVSVVIPSMLSTDLAGKLYLQTAIDSVFAQTCYGGHVRIFVGVDRDADTPSLLPAPYGIFPSTGKSLSKAVNAAAATIDSDFVAMLEDDDKWHPAFLATALAALETTDFCSSTQIEVDPSGDVVRINDFPTPSGWVMRREVWEKVGGFNEEYQIHQDNEWLGRLSASGAHRVHLVEKTAPIHPEMVAQVRPWLANVQKVSALRRHSSPVPLVTRQVHVDSWMGRVSAGGDAERKSHECYQMLMNRFGTIPW